MEKQKADDFTFSIGEASLPNHDVDIQDEPQDVVPLLDKHNISVEEESQNDEKTRNLKT